MKKLFYISLLSLLFLGVSSFAQSRRQLERKRNKLQKDIKKVERILSKTKAKKTDALGDLKDLKQKISIRENLVETIRLETAELSKDIKTNQKKIKQKNQELSKLKADYATMVFKSYKSKSHQSKTLFILSSESFLQAYKRLKYMEQYKEFRKQQGQEITSKTTLILQLNDSLKKVKRIKNSLISSEEKEKTKIEAEKKNQVALISKIKKEEKKYRKQLKRKIKEQKRISAKIDKAIRDAIAKANRGKKGAKKGRLTLSAAEKKLKSKFEQNKGRLPSPLNDGVVTRRFGVQPHPTFKQIKINSTGLHIRGKKGAIAKSIFNGKVLVVQLLSKGRKSVFIQHGSYITAYNNLEKVFVSKGQKIKTGDKLGVVFTNKVTGKTSLLFVLSKNTKRLNPQKWIKIN